MAGPFSKSYWVKLPNGPTIKVDRQYSGDTDNLLTSGVEQETILSPLPAGSRIVSQQYNGSVSISDKPQKAEYKDDSFIDLILDLCYLPSELFSYIPIVGKPLSIASWVTTSCMLWGGLFYNLTNIRIPIVHEISTAGWYVSSQSSNSVHQFLMKESQKTETQFDDIVFSLSGMPFYLSAGFMEGVREGIHGK
jgi:hypothetical protein